MSNISIDGPRLSATVRDERSCLPPILPLRADFPDIEVAGTAWEDWDPSRRMEFLLAFLDLAIRIKAVEVSLRTLSSNTDSIITEVSLWVRQAKYSRSVWQVSLRVYLDAWANPIESSSMVSPFT